MRVFLLNNGVEGDYDLETVLDAGFPYSSVDKAKAAAQADAGAATLGWYEETSNLRTWTATVPSLGMFWRIRECELDG